MSDSTEFSSLFALVESHLSKTSVKESQSNERTKGPFQIPTLEKEHGSSSSESYLLTSQKQRLPIPTFNLSQNPITSVLAEQVSNMLKAKERKKQEEIQKLENEMKNMKLEEDNNYVIDLMKVLQIKTPTPEIKPVPEEPLSRSSSFETLFEPKFLEFTEETETLKIPEPLLPCITDMSYILKHKVKRGKCSTFGKVLSARLRPVAAPYLGQTIKSNIKVFDFSTPSPCDEFKSKLRKPTMSCSLALKINF